MSRPAPATRERFRWFRRYSTRWADNDAYGHVNNTVYYEWFDSAVNAWLLDRGLISLADDPVIALVVETRCTYRSSLAYPQDVEVGIAITDTGRSSMRYAIGIFAVDAEVAAAEGEFVHVLVDQTSRRPIALPDRWLEALSELRVG